jgi:hypothetical protein
MLVQTFTPLPKIPENIKYFVGLFGDSLSKSQTPSAESYNIRTYI